MTRVRIASKTAKRKKKKAPRGFKHHGCLCTPETVQRTYEMAKNGSPIDYICAILGVSRMTMTTWISRGMAYEANGHKPKEDICFASWLQHYEKGRAEFLDRMQRETHQVVDHHPDNPALIRAVTFNRIAILMRRDKRNYSANTQIDSGPESDSSGESETRYL